MFGHFIREILSLSYLGYFVAPDKRGNQVNIFVYFTMKPYVVGTYLKRLGELLLMSIHNIRFCGKIRKFGLKNATLI